ncbi:hypothetical protein [Nocardia sp. NPDC049707]|uniref:hypothetical protein n=1 Tax=Nocardia sp. NPDC049707 TaxID=3154735 RepID=UPI00342F045F
MVPFLDLGRYPLHTMADLCCFDFYTHLRWDILTPRGPLTCTIAPADDLRLDPSMSWLLAGIPQMQPNLPTALTGTIDLNLSGPGGGVWRLQRVNDMITVEPGDGTTDADAIVTSDTNAFAAWSTTRIPWRDAATIGGDQRVATEFLDALNLT